LSVKAAPVTAVLFGFVSTIVSTEVPPGAMVLGANDLAAVGAAITERPAGVTEFVTRDVPPMLAAVLL
jgi:hypothetical protein